VLFRSDELVARSDKEKAEQERKVYLGMLEKSGT